VIAGAFLRGELAQIRVQATGGEHICKQSLANGRPTWSPTHGRQNIARPLESIPVRSKYRQTRMVSQGRMDSTILSNLRVPLNAKS
jgi:hypothetical protein